MRLALQGQLHHRQSRQMAGFGCKSAHRTFDKRPQVNQAAIVENKRLGPVLAYIAEKQKELDMSRSAKAPRRRGLKTTCSRSDRSAEPPGAAGRIQPQTHGRAAILLPTE
jgi:hypothetical protein